MARRRGAAGPAHGGQRGNARSSVVSLVDLGSFHDPASFVRIVAASAPKRAVYRAVTGSFEYDAGWFSHVSDAFVMPVEATFVYDRNDARLAPYIPDRESRSVRQSPFFEPGSRELPSE